MKKFLCLCLALLLCCTLVACDQSSRMKVEITYDDMAPTFSSGESIVCESVDPHTLKTGDIIAYWTIMDGQRLIYVSRITEIYDGGDGLWLFQTQGDNMDQPNATVVHETNVVGKYVRKTILDRF